MEIKPVQAEDLEVMHGLYESLAGETRSSLSLDSLKKDFENSKSVFLSAFTEEGRLAGFIGGFILTPEEAEIRYLGVEKRLWGQGIGQTLVLAFCQKLSKFSKVVLEVAAPNSRAIGFYERLGARKLTSRKNYYGDCGAWVMELRAGDRVRG